MGVTYICRTCSGSNVTRDAWAEWDVDQQIWVLGAIYDFAFCHDCEEETQLLEVEVASPA